MNAIRNTKGSSDEQHTRSKIFYLLRGNGVVDSPDSEVGNSERAERPRWRQRPWWWAAWDRFWRPKKFEIEKKTARIYLFKS